MKCTEVEVGLNLLIDGEAGSKKRGQVEAHLETCSSCRANYSNLQDVKTSLREVLPIAPSDSLDRRTLIAFQNYQNKHQPKAEEKKGRWFAFPKLVFTGLILLFALFSSK